ncbi:hypothetical protein AAJ76_850007169 [Vairimorpha ceranae]|uniref:Uncharacterized protein n=1 Tax=Vairimorpha ceranae TaxID=40302 RepID=A0A0F9WBP7_9MICR|nr:hypothetical protein AAJ76_850007169 [Vairimorpha ceranae]KKO74305.1 hypothetical protein AAJ76_850007169 [Vairimorpha ceranae]
MKHLNPISYANQTLRPAANLLVTHTGDHFYQYGPENLGNFKENYDLLLFHSESAVQKLRHNGLWAVDGTFSMILFSYFQLYTINYVPDNHVFPVVFSILKNKSH